MLLQKDSRLTVVLVRDAPKRLLHNGVRETTKLDVNIGYQQFDTG